MQCKSDDRPASNEQSAGIIVQVMTALSFEVHGPLASVASVLA
jgi:hypothetical protein